MTNPIVIPPATSNFRDLGDAISPSWWNGPNGQRLRYAMSVIIDALADGAGYAVLARFPDTAPPDAIQWLALDRQIDQGFAEPGAHYTGRLKQWLDIWPWAGLPTGILMALLSDVFPVQPKILTVSTGNAVSGVFAPMTTWWTYSAGTEPMPYPASMPTPPVQFQQGALNWRWDSVSAPFLYPIGWYRMWVVLFSVGGAPWPAPTHTLGDGSKLGDGSCLGWAGTNSQARTIAALCRKFRAAHCSIPFVIVSYDATMFDSTLAFGSAKLPDGTWGRWGKVVGGVMVAARPPCTTCSFLDGAP